MTATHPRDAARNIAANVRRLRREQEWEQRRAADVLRSIGGPSWSVAVWSSMERSAETDRVRAFTAEEVAYLALLFDVTVCSLFQSPPPPPAPCRHCGGSGVEEGGA